MIKGSVLMELALSVCMRWCYEKRGNERAEAANPHDNHMEFTTYVLRHILFYQGRGFVNKSFYESHSHEDITLAKSKLAINTVVCLLYV